MVPLTSLAADSNYLIIHAHLITYLYPTGQSVIVNLQPHLKQHASSLLTPLISVPVAWPGITLLKHWCFYCANN